MHDSDRATNNAPALPVADCDCNVVRLTERLTAGRKAERPYWYCRCGNETLFRLYGGGDIACGVCGSTHPCLRTVHQSHGAA